MTDYEISRNLALAIGRHDDDVTSFDGHRISVYVAHRGGFGSWREFDYRDPTVIWAIAERYRCFPEWQEGSNEWWSSVNVDARAYADTAAKAVAMAVIGLGKLES